MPRHYLASSIRLTSLCLTLLLLPAACDVPDDMPNAGDEIETRQAALDEGGDSRHLSAFAQRALLISTLPVVANPTRTSDACQSIPSDANRKWNFGYLMAQAANQTLTGITASAFVREWLRTWSTPQTVAGEVVQPFGLGALVQQQWEAKSRSSGATGGKLLMEHAPFRLSAITVRFDLRKNRRFGEGLGGELRFVFGHTLLTVRDQFGKCAKNGGEGSTVILEYAVDKADENQVWQWAKSWENLRSLDVASETYRIELEKLTESVVRAGASSQRTNRSALIRIRTSEQPNQDLPWDMREWNISATTKMPAPTTLKQTPRMAFMGPDLAQLFDSPEIGQYINANYTAVMHDTYRLPDTFGGQPFIAKSFINDINHTRAWYSSAVDPEARHMFAKGTCVGCHSGETGTRIFQISPRHSWEEAKLSPFLMGEGPGMPVLVGDPVVGGLNREFHELDARELDHAALVGQLPVMSPIPRRFVSQQVAGQNYKLRFKHSGKCADLLNSSTTAGTRLQQWTCSGNANQRFMLEEMSDTYYRLRIKNSNLCADVPVNGTQIVQRACADTLNQKFIAVPQNDKSHVLIFAHSGKCLELQGGSGSNGANVIQAECQWTAQQKVDFVE
jgi:hypothetical protein